MENILDDDLSLHEELPEYDPLESIVEWWESKRRGYNQRVGAIGLFGGVLLSLMAIELVVICIIFGIFTAIIANILFCSGWLIECVYFSFSHRLFGDRFRKGLYMVGLVFSMLLVGMISIIPAIIGMFSGAL